MRSERRHYARCATEDCARCARYEQWARRQWRIVGLAAVVASGAVSLTVLFALLHTVTAR